MRDDLAGDAIAAIDHHALVFRARHSSGAAKRPVHAALLAQRELPETKHAVGAGEDDGMCVIGPEHQRVAGAIDAGLNRRAEGAGAAALVRAEVVSPHLVGSVTNQPIELTLQLNALADDLPRRDARVPRELHQVVADHRFDLVLLDTTEHTVAVVRHVDGALRDETSGRVDPAFDFLVEAGS